MAKRDGLLAAGTEFGPELDDRRVVAEAAALGQDMDDGRGRSLANREVVEGCVRGHGTFACRIGDARHGVDHEVRSPVRGDLDSTLASGLDQLVNGVLHQLLGIFHGLRSVRRPATQKLIGEPGR